MNLSFVLDRYFAPVSEDVLLATELYKGEYDPFLVLLSGMISVGCAYIALSAVSRSREALHWSIYAGWMTVGSMTMGVGVWAMHFVGMLSFELPCAVEYDPITTLLSMLPSIVASMIALSVVRHREKTPGALRVLGAVLMAGGIAAMHYTGMAAMRMDAILYYNGGRVGLSVLVAVTLAWLALSVPGYLLTNKGTFYLLSLRRLGLNRIVATRILSALCLGLAVAGMHYTAMWAALFKPAQGLLLRAPVWEPGFLVLWILLAVALMATAVIAVVFASKQRVQADELKAEIALRRRVEAAVEEQRARLQAIIDNVVDGIITINDKGTIQHWSPAAAALFGYRDDEVTGQNVTMLMAEPLEDEHGAELNEFQPREGAQILGIGRETTGVRKDGTTFPLDISIGSGEVNGKPFYTGVMRDLTQRKQELAILEEARDRAQKAVKAKSEFLANMSHEIRTPMNGVIGFLGLALDRKDVNEEIRSYLDTAQTSANNLLIIIDDILDFSRLEDGRIKLEAIPFDIHKLVRTTVHGLSTLAKDKGLSLDVRVAEDVPVITVGDPTRIRQILINLLSNAFKFTREGSVTVDVKPETEGSNTLLFSVADTGIGMSPETLERVLQPFEQADSSTHRLYGGTGLGITISSQLAQLHGGAFWGESEEGKGTTFYFTVEFQENKDFADDEVPEWIEDHLHERFAAAGPGALADTGPTPPIPSVSGEADRANLRLLFKDLYRALEEDNPEPVERVLDKMSDALGEDVVLQMRRSVSQFDFSLTRDKADRLLTQLHLAEEF